MLARFATAIPKTADGVIEMIRQLKVAHDTAVKDRTSARVTLKAMLVHSSEDKSKRDIIRCLKRSVIREDYHLVKTELIRQRDPWRTVEQVELATLEYVSWWNNQRLHGELGMRTPIEAEQSYYAGLESPLETNVSQATK